MIVRSIKAEYQGKYNAAEVSTCTRETGNDSVSGGMDMWDDRKVSSVASIYNDQYLKVVGETTYP
jgi:hypothetical protein